jgi:hypothetical protein
MHIDSTPVRKEATIQFSCHFVLGEQELKKQKTPMNAQEIHQCHFNARPFSWPVSSRVH